MYYEWHQDFLFYPHANDYILAVGVAIDDMTIENGPLLITHDLHKGALYSYHQAGRFGGAVTVDVPNADQAMSIELKVGGVSIHHAQVLHASLPNTSGCPRRLLLLSIMLLTLDR